MFTAAAHSSLFSTWGAALAILAIWLHLEEECAFRFGPYLNFRLSRDSERPISEIESFIKDKLALGLTLTVLVWLGRKDSSCAQIAMGVLVADLIQHVIFTIQDRKYTPGFATCALYLAIVYFFPWSAVVTPFTVLGASFIFLNYVTASLRAK